MTRRPTEPSSTAAPNSSRGAVAPRAAAAAAPAAAAPVGGGPNGGGGPKRARKQSSESTTAQPSSSSTTTANGASGESTAAAAAAVPSSSAAKGSVQGGGAGPAASPTQNDSPPLLKSIAPRRRRRASADASPSPSPGQLAQTIAGTSARHAGSSGSTSAAGAPPSAANGTATGGSYANENLRLLMSEPVYSMSGKGDHHHSAPPAADLRPPSLHLHAPQQQQNHLPPASQRSSPAPPPLAPPGSGGGGGHPHRLNPGPVPAQALSSSRRGGSGGGGGGYQTTNTLFGGTIGSGGAGVGGAARSSALNSSRARASGGVSARPPPTTTSSNVSSSSAAAAAAAAASPHRLSATHRGSGGAVDTSARRTASLNMTILPNPGGSSTLMSSRRAVDRNNSDAVAAILKGGTTTTTAAVAASPRTSLKGSGTPRPQHPSSGPPASLTTRKTSLLGSVRGNGSGGSTTNRRSTPLTPNPTRSLKLPSPQRPTRRSGQRGSGSVTPDTGASSHGAARAGSRGGSSSTATATNTAAQAVSDVGMNDRSAVSDSVLETERVPNGAAGATSRTPPPPTISPPHIHLSGGNENIFDSTQMLSTLREFTSRQVSEDVQKAQAYDHGIAGGDGCTPFSLGTSMSKPRGAGGGPPPAAGTSSSSSPTATAPFLENRTRRDSAEPPYGASINGLFPAGNEASGGTVSSARKTTTTAAAAAAVTVASGRGADSGNGNTYHNNHTNAVNSERNSGRSGGGGGGDQEANKVTPPSPREALSGKPPLGTSPRGHTPRQVGKQSSEAPTPQSATAATPPLGPSETSPSRSLVRQVSNTNSTPGAVPASARSQRESSATALGAQSQPNYDFRVVLSSGRGSAMPISLSVGSGSLQGLRPTMEDEHFAKLNATVVRDQPVSLVAVLDGHCGRRVADLGAKWLPEYFFAHNALGDNNALALVEAILQTDRAIFHALHNTAHGKQGGRTFGSALFGTDSDISGGSTLIVAAIHGRMLYVGCLGDARAVLYDGHTTVAMSEDHKPNNPKESQRISKCGGFVNFGRVCGILAVSRALGDFEFKTPNSGIASVFGGGGGGGVILSGCGMPAPCGNGGGAKDSGGGGPRFPANRDFMVSNVADVRQINLTDDSQFLLLACDGLWDVITNDEATQFVRDFLTYTPDVNDPLIARGEKPRPSPAIIRRALDSCCQKLAEFAVDRGSTDNVSVVVVFFHDVIDAVQSFVREGIEASNASSSVPRSARHPPSSQAYGRHSSLNRTNSSSGHVTVSGSGGAMLFPTPPRDTPRTRHITSSATGHDARRGPPHAPPPSTAVASPPRPTGRSGGGLW